MSLLLHLNGRVLCIWSQPSNSTIPLWLWGWALSVPSHLSCRRSGNLCLNLFPGPGTLCQHEVPRKHSGTEWTRDMCVWKLQQVCPYYTRLLLSTPLGLGDPEEELFRVPSSQRQLLANLRNVQFQWASGLGSVPLVVLGAGESAHLKWKQEVSLKCTLSPTRPIRSFHVGHSCEAVWTVMVADPPSLEQKPLQFFAAPFQKIIIHILTHKVLMFENIQF